MNSLKETNIKNRTYYFFNDMIYIKSIDPNEFKMDYKKYTTLDTWWSEFGCITINSVNPLCLIIDKINGYIKESNGNKYLILVPTDKDTFKKRKNCGVKSEILLGQ